MSHDMQLSKKRRDYLESLGFVQTIKPEPSLNGLVNKITAMEKWEKHTVDNREIIYINYREGKSAFCELYYGFEDNGCEEFSARNLISEMQKRQL